MLKEKKKKVNGMMVRELNGSVLLIKTEEKLIEEVAETKVIII